MVSIENLEQDKKPKTIPRHKSKNNISRTNVMLPLKGEKNNQFSKIVSFKQKNFFIIRQLYIYVRRDNFFCGLQL